MRPPAVLRAAAPEALERLLDQRDRADQTGRAFLGAGGTPWYVPEAVRVAARRPAAVRGARSLIAHSLETLLGFPWSASGCGDAAAAAVACLHALASTGSRSRVAVAATLPAAERRALAAGLRDRAIEVSTIPADPRSGRTDAAALGAQAASADAVLIAQPNAYGVLEDVSALARRAHRAGARLVARVDPMLQALLAPAGTCGADLACGDLQPFGLGVDGHAAFIAGHAAARPLRGALAPAGAGAVAAVAAYLRAQGGAGLAARAARACRTAARLRARLTRIAGVSRAFGAPHGNAFTLRLPGPARNFLRPLAAHDLLAGDAWDEEESALADCLRVSVSDCHDAEDVRAYAALLERLVGALAGPRCPVRPRL